MTDFLRSLDTWSNAGQRSALATVVETWGSSPRPVGSMMAVREDGLVLGSVSGGCVEGSVIEEAQRVIEGGPAKFLEYAGMEPDEVWRVGLTCGGRVRVLLAPGPSGADAEVWARALVLSESREPYAWVTALSDGECSHGLVHSDGTQIGAVSPGWVDQASEALRAKMNLALEDGFIHYRARPDRLILAGAVHISLALIPFAKQLGFETVVMDPRGALATDERFPVSPDQCLVVWPHEALGELALDEDTYAVLLSHDPKIDDPALHVLLRSPVRYIGALGSKKTHAERVVRLSEAGFTAEEIERIHAPIGLSIGAKTPDEIALSIAAELVSARRSAVITQS
ncbi:MAG: XdhC family protein [Armatimonadetes bacterium]|nr:XdhC family protein [Armatimonadota bacterium]